MAGSLGELFISLGFDVDDDKLKAFKSSLRDTHEEMVKLGTVAGGAAASMALFVQHGADGAVRLNNMASLWGANIQGAQTFANVLNQVNSQISVSAGQEKYRAFAEMINAKVPVGGGAYAALAQLGVTNPWANPDDVLSQIRHNLPANMSRLGPTPDKQRARASDLLAQIGLGDSLNAILQPDSKYNAAGQYNIQQGTLDNLSKYAKATAEFDQAMHKFSTDMAGELGEKLVKVVEFLTKAVNFIDNFNNAHPGVSVVEGSAGATLAGMGGWAVLKRLFGGGAGAAAAEAFWDAGAALGGGAAGVGLGTAGLVAAAAGGLVFGSSWIGSKIGESLNGNARGERNNNRGNIKYGDFAKSHGATGADDKGFAIFPNQDAGDTAIAALLQSYGGKGIDTIHGIVSRYTSGDSAATQASYEKMLEGMTGRGGSDHLNLSDPQVLSQLVTGIARQENGNKSIVINVHSNATDPHEVANIVQNHIQQQYNGAYSQTNVGPQL